MSRTFSANSRGGRIHKFKDPKPIQIQQEEIWIRSGSTTFSILRSGFRFRSDSKQPKVDLRITKTDLHLKFGRFFCQNSGEDKQKGLHSKLERFFCQTSCEDQMIKTSLRNVVLILSPNHLGGGGAEPHLDLDLVGIRIF